MNKKIDKWSIIGFILLGLLFVAYVYINQPTPEELAEKQRLQDSVELAQKQLEFKDSSSESRIFKPDTLEATSSSTPTEDSLLDQRAILKYGDFAPASKGKANIITLENEVLKLDFSTKGGKIVSAWLKDYQSSQINDAKETIKDSLFLMDNINNTFEYLIPIKGIGVVSTEDLYFEAEKSDNKITFTAKGANGTSFSQSYTLGEDYTLSYSLDGNTLDKNLDGDVVLNWENYLNKLEKNIDYEKSYSTVYYKKEKGGLDHCSCTGDGTEDTKQKPVKWVSHSNQFFNTTLIANNTFGKMLSTTEALEGDSLVLKKVTTKLDIPAAAIADNFDMKMYVGPNEFSRLRALDEGVEDIIPFGWGIFGFINKWVVRPVFDFLGGFVGTKGIVIILLTLVVKLALYPLTYRMLYSQSKMAALKPEIAKLKEKVGDDQQKMQVESMKLYRETGVNPLGGCLPMVLQMPIWFALYRFFPASIDFRQVGFLWADDLSSFDVFFWIPFEIPEIVATYFGEHVSLFTFLWAVTTLLYTYINSKTMDMSQMNNNPAMKYVQYFMPIFFLVFFNKLAAGLTCYLLFSNILNISQTLITKHIIIDQDKVAREIDAYRKKPKKKGGFQERLQNALQEQQKVAAERERQRNNKNKKK